MIAVADTSGLLALFNRSDPEHAQVRACADSCGLLVVSPLAVTEVHQVASVRGGRDAADTILNTLANRIRSGRMALAETSDRTLRAAVAVRSRYADLDLDLADAAGVVAAAEFRTHSILTLDRRDFRVLRPLTDHATFRLLPDDA